MKTWKRGRRPPEADAGSRSPDVDGAERQLPGSTPAVSSGDSTGLLASIGHGVSSAATTARDGVNSLVEHAPGALGATRAALSDSTSALQALPDSTLRWLAASSIGLGAGFALAHAPRLAVAAGVAPALLIGRAIALRPAEPVVAAEAPE
jgi:hypothetical protein